MKQAFQIVFGEAIERYPEKAVSDRVQNGQLDLLRRVRNAAANQQVNLREDAELILIVLIDQMIIGPGERAGAEGVGELGNWVRSLDQDLELIIGGVEVPNDTTPASSHDVLRSVVANYESLSFSVGWL